MVNVSVEKLVSANNVCVGQKAPDRENPVVKVQHLHPGRRMKSRLADADADHSVKGMKNLCPNSTSI
jgi:hypothetical protein